MTTWGRTLAEMPLIAILRGLDPARAVEVATVLVEAGFRMIEVPLNSPDPFTSIEAIARKFGQDVMVGAGTVLAEDDVDRVVDVGGQIIVAPNMNADVGRRSRQAGAYWCPGVATPTEAFEALSQGASALKFFPAELIPPPAIAAMRAVLPKDATIAAVGGITPETMGGYHAVGTQAFGLGSALFKPDYTLADIRSRASAFVEAYRALDAG